MTDKSAIFDPFFDDLFLPPADFLTLSKQVNIIFDKFRTLDKFYICDKYDGFCSMNYECDYVREHMESNYGLQFWVGDTHVQINEQNMLRDDDGKCVMPI